MLVFARLQILFEASLDVVKSLDTVDQGFWDLVLSGLVLLAWLLLGIFEVHSHVEVGIKLAVGFGMPWTRDGGIPQSCSIL